METICYWVVMVTASFLLLVCVVRAAYLLLKPREFECCVLKSPEHHRRTPNRKP